jgi:hypothetical protein
VKSSILKQKLQLGNIIDRGNLTEAQKWSSIIATGVIEGGLTYAFGNIRFFEYS